MTVQVVDNFLPDDLHHHLCHVLLNDTFPWYFTEDVAYAGSKKEEQDFLFFHHFYKNEQQCSPYFHSLILPILGHLRFRHLLHAKANCYTRKATSFQHAFHVDNYEPCRVGLYALNSNNGYTTFMNGDTFPSIANQMIFFDANVDHASAPQTDTALRVNINFNFTAL
jgi:hypothetical protein